MSVTQFTLAARTVAVVRAELCQSAHGDAVFLVGPDELEPEVALGEGRRGTTAGEEYPQRSVTVRGELVDARLQRAELFQNSARQKPRHLPGVIRTAHRCISVSNSAVDSSSS